MAQQNLPDNGTAPNGKRLYGAFLGGKIVDVSHSYAAVRRRNPERTITNVRETYRLRHRDGVTVRYEVIGE